MPQATLALRTAQHTSLTPRLQQSVRLLQLSSHDFAQELEQALATNPFLEVPSADEPALPIDASAWNSGEGDAARDGAGTAADGTDAFPNAEAPFEGCGGDAGPVAQNLDSFPDGPETFDYAAFGEGSVARDGEELDIGSWAEAATTLRMHLHEQLLGSRIATRDRGLAELVIEALDDDGYLRQSLEDVAARFDFVPPVTPDELAVALELIQQTGPPGIGARSVAECLGLQLDALRSDPDSDVDHAVLAIASAMVHDHLSLVASHDWAGIRRLLGCSITDVTSAAELIRSLDPRPGAGFGSEVAQAIVPDVIVRKQRNKWHADINPAVIPRLSLNRVYAALFHDARGGDRQPLGQQLQEARWLLRNAAQRFVTIRRVARVIVAEQAAFLEYGDIAIKPLLLRQVADRLDLHDSTISRAINNKFMATPRGVFAFKHFFSRQLATVSGGTCSTTSIRAAMRELIDAEDPNDPLSDVMLTKRLSDQGLCVARRTVTKYRGLMRIPPVEMRRQYEVA